MQIHEVWGSALEDKQAAFEPRHVIWVMWFWDTTSPWNAVLLETSESSWKKRTPAMSQPEGKERLLPEENRSGEGVAGVAPSLGRKWWGAGMEIHNDLEAGAGWGMLSQLCHPAAWSPGSPRYIPAHVCLKGTGKDSCLPCKWHPAPQLLAHSGLTQWVPAVPTEHLFTERFKQ